MFDELKRAIPSPAAVWAISLGVAGAAGMWSSPVERVVTNLFSLPADRVTAVQVFLMLSCLVVALIVALFFVVRLFRQRELAHKVEISQMKEAHERHVSSAISNALLARPPERDAYPSARKALGPVYPDVMPDGSWPLGVLPPGISRSKR